MSLSLTFLGAAGTVTGSKHLIAADGRVWVVLDAAALLGRPVD